MPAVPDTLFVVPVSHVAVAVFVPTSGLFKYVHTYGTCSEPPADTDSFTPPAASVMLHVPPLSTESVTVMPVTSAPVGLAIVMIPATSQPDPASCVTVTV